MAGDFRSTTLKNVSMRANGSKGKEMAWADISGRMEPFMKENF